jgi:hypothetical protein
VIFQWVCLLLWKGVCSEKRQSEEDGLEKDPGTVLCFVKPTFAGEALRKRNLRSV